MIQNTDFTATTAYPLFLRSYSRTSVTGAKETAKEAKDRAIRGLQDFGLLTDKELELVREYFYKNIVFVSGRWFWIGGTDWVKQQKNFIGAYNCASVPVDSWEAFRFNFRALLMGCGVGTVVEEHIINQLPEIKYPVEVKEVIELGSQWDEDNIFESSNYTYSLDSDSKALIIKYKVGDSKEGWVDIATDLLKFASFDFSYNFENVKYEKIHLYLDLSEVRPAGKTLKGFGGLSNPEKLEEGLKNIIKILNTSVGRKLNSLEICKILAIHGVIAVSGNIRRCIAYGERVSAISGMIPIQDIKVGDLVLTSSGEYRPVKNVFNQGEQEIVEVRTPTTSIKCTSNHRVAVFDSLNSYTWKYAGKLIKGDRLVSVPHKKGSMTTTTDWAWLVGFFLGDGHADIASAKRRNGGEGSVVFAMSTPRLKGELGKKVLQILVGMGYTPTSRIKENTAFICVYKKELAEELGQYKWSWATPIIPEWVWNGTVEIRASFLAGLSDADGAPSGNVLLNSTKLEFLRNVQKLALSLGIATGWKSSIAPSTKIKRDINYDTLLEKGLVNSNWIPLEVQFVAPIGTAKTFDIEVEDDHEFIASGLLVHNSARINQGTPSDKFFSESKDNLWIQDDQGNWKIDPDRDMLRFGNHTLCYHNKPDLETIIEAVRKQYYSGEGAIQYVPEAIARGNVDLLNTSEKKLEFIALYCQSRRDASNYLLSLKEMDSKELKHRMQRYSSNPCFEVLGEKFLCNLSQVHLNNLDPNNELQQVEAFKASTLAALPLLSHEFDIEDFKYSREIDPIIGISFTGLFDFFVNKFGADWLLWWKTGRSKDSSKAQYFLDTERYYLELWKNSVKETVEEYCKRHNIKQPNRYSVVQPSGSVSLLTNASAGWHAPKATRYIRRITFSSNSPIVSASKDYGYNIVPSQSCKDENGNLLNDINDPRVNEVLIEIPVEVSWASIADRADYNPSENTVLAQLDFFMQVQKYYATHTVSATIELTEAEIEPLGTAIYNLIQNDEGYISAALLAKFDSLETFPRLPFEPITHEKYLKEMQAVKNRQISTDFVTLVNQYSKGFDFVAESGSTGCDSDKCLMPEKSK